MLQTQPDIGKQEVPAGKRQIPSDTASKAGGQPRRLFVRRNEYAELSVVKVASVKVDDNVPGWLGGLFNEYTDIFPAKLPDGLLPARAVHFDVEMKSDAIPSSRAPFRLSKTDQEALKM